MAKYIKKKALKNAIECCTWYHINKNGELVEGANPADHEPLYKYSDIKKIIKGLPTRKFKDEPTISKMEQVDEPQTDCGDFADRLAYERGVKHAWKVAQKVFGSTVTFYEAEDVAKQIDKDINVRSKDEPQTPYDNCQSCLHWVYDGYWYCECNECRYEPKDEPQTDCAWK